MRRSFSFIICLLAVVAPVSAQDSSRAMSAGSVAGVVVKEPGSEPVKKVLVQLVAEDQKQGGNYTVTTDGDGRFRIENILPGRYRAFLEKTGFSEVNARARRVNVDELTVQPGHPLEDLVFRMIPTAVITGRITDEDGDPIASVRIVALKKVPGKTKRQSVNAVQSDDQGEYRISGLFPGQYWILAMPPPDARDFERRSDQSGASGSEKETRYLTTYYPGTYDSAQASSVALKASEEMPVNLMLVPARTYRVRGVVAALPPGKRVDVELISKLGDSVHGAEVGSNGEFEIHGVAPGSYILRANATAEATVETARQEITVAAADLDGVKLTPLPSFRLSGHLSVQSQSPTDVTQYSVNLRLAELPDDPGIFMSQDFFGENAAVDRSGNFEWKNVNPGTYVVQVYGGDGKEDFFVKSAKMGDRDLDAAAAINGPATVDVVVSTNAGQLEGVVTSHQQQPAAQSQENNPPANSAPPPANLQTSDMPVSNATVIAVPEEKYRKIPGRFGHGATDQYGRFTIRGLAAGTYTLFAWQDLEEDIYNDPDFLRSQESNGVSAKVEEGSRQRVVLKLSEITDDWR